MKKLASVVLIVLFAMTIAHAGDFTLQGNNEARWADGLERLGGQDHVYRYFENRLNLNMYYDNLRFGMRYTVLQPSEFGEEVTGTESLEKRFLEYRGMGGDLTVRAGDFYTVWGRGLTLALMEDINQGFDSSLDGLLVRGRYENIEVEALSGRSSQGWLGYVREAQVSGAHIACELPYNFTLAGQSMLVTPVEDVISYDESRTWGGYLAYQGPVIGAHVEHAREHIEGIDDEHHGTYVQFTGVVGQLGISLDYKNYQYYRYSSGAVGGDNPYAASVDILPFHSAPIVQRDFTSALFGKHPHIVKFNDEVGMQLELTYSPFDWGTMVLSLAQSSSTIENENMIPTLDEEDSPYRELFLEFQAFPNMDLYTTWWAGWSEELDYYNEGNVRTRISWDKRAVLGTKTEYAFMPNWTIVGYAEGMRVTAVEAEANGDDDNHMEALFNLGFVYLANYTLTFSYEMTGEENPQEGRDSWFNVSGRAFIDNRHELLVTVGQERGGLVCTSGKCRWVSPFNGVKLTLTSIF